MRRWKKPFSEVLPDEVDEHLASIICVGVSGFSYPRWKGRFYPDGLKDEQFLAYYSGRLNSVEINSSFYSQPSASMVKGWAGRTGDGFRFSFKAPRQITHILKLSEGSAPAAVKFAQTVSLLGKKQGPVLFQLPPYSKKDHSLLEAFLIDTDKVSGRVLEFRHESWFEEATFRLLDEHRAGFCVAESEELKPVLRTTGGVGYFRLRKESYDGEDIDRWADRIRLITKGVEGAYVYIRHDETGENAILAQKLAGKLAA